MELITEDKKGVYLFVACYNDDSQKKLAFIAGGIGITPYRSMIKYLVDINEKRIEIVKLE